jgi:transposase-like protein
MKRSRAEWEQIIQAQASSGMSKSEYCRSNGITENTFEYWRSKLRSSGEPRFVKVGAEAKFEVQLKCGAILSIPITVGAEQLKSVLMAVSNAES